MIGELLGGLGGLIPLAAGKGGFDLASNLQDHAGPLFLNDLGVSLNIFNMWLASGALIAVAILAAKSGEGRLVPVGPFRNMIEVFLLFIRDELARPNLGKSGDKYLPVLWTFFFFILFSNLGGLVPGAHTATSSIWVTAGLAMFAAGFYHVCGIWEQGLVPYVKHLVPGGVPLALWPLLFVIELAGHVAKPFALAVRLCANMNGGHIVMLAFFGMIYFIGTGTAVVVIPITIAIYFLEIFVALVQAYVFTFLVTVFLGGALHPH